MDGFFLLIIVGGVLSAVVGAVFWGGVAWFGVKAVQNLSGQFPQVGTGTNAEFERSMEQLLRLIAQAQNQQQAGGLANLALLQQQFNNQAFKAQQHMREFDRLSRERYETKVSGMLSDASAAGIDVSNWRF